MPGPDTIAKLIPTLERNEVYNALQTGPSGLTQQEAAKRLTIHGPNIIQEKKQKPILFTLASNFTHLMAVLLWAGGIIAFLARLPELGIAIWLVNLINGFFSFWQQYKARKATEALRRLVPSFVKVVRDGQEVRVSAEELVPGDFTVLSEGDRVPAEPGVLDNPPRRLREHVITPALLIRAYLWQGIPQSLAVMAAFYLQYWLNGHYGQWVGLPNSGALYHSATAMALAAVVMTQIGNLFTQRSETISVFRLGRVRNRLIYIGVLSEVVIILLIVYTPLLNSFIGTAPFAVGNWLFLVCLIPLLIISDEIRKYLTHRTGPTRKGWPVAENHLLCRLHKNGRRRGTP